MLPVRCRVFSKKSREVATHQYGECYFTLHTHARMASTMISNVRHCNGTSSGAGRHTASSLPAARRVVAVAGRARPAPATLHRSHHFDRRVDGLSSRNRVAGPARASGGGGDTPESFSSSAASSSNASSSKSSTLNSLDSILGTPEESASASPSLEENEKEEEEEEEEHQKPKPSAAADIKATKASDASAGVLPDGVTRADWKPWWSPLSPYYNVPTCAPIAAYALAFFHVAFFAGDYYLYSVGAGNGGDIFLRLAEVDDALIRGRALYIRQLTRPLFSST